MQTVNSISGGKTSSYLAMHYPANYDVFSVVCIDDPTCSPKDLGLLKYVNDKLEKYHHEFGEFIATAEDDDTLIAMRDLEQLLGREIIYVRGKSFDDLLTSKRAFGGEPTRLPSWARRYCTLEMKLLPIFYWWYYNISTGDPKKDKVQMRIGFRVDEYDRMEKFFNKAVKEAGFKIPIYCKTYGQKQMHHQVFDWRFCHFPLVKHQIQNHHVIDYWNNNGLLGNTNLFEQSRQIKFPQISNCVGCFHKKENVLATECIINPEKMRWFASKEKLGKGTWLDNKMTYSEIMDRKYELAMETQYEIKAGVYSCDSEGCGD